MTAIIIPRRHYTQPQGRVEVAPEWATGLRFVGLGEHTNNVLLGKDGAIGGDSGAKPYPSVCEVGRALSFLGNGGAVGGYAEFPDIQYLAPPFSVLLLVRKAALASEALMAFGGAGAGGGWKVGSYLGSRNLSFTFGGVADYQVETDWFPATPGFAVTVVTVSGNLLSAYTRGRKAIKTVGTPKTATKPLTLGASFNGSAYADHSASDIALSALWSRSLPEPEARDLVEKPWQIFRADPTRIYSLPSGPISVSWSSLTASNITQTTATLTLGGIVR